MSHDELAEVLGTIALSGTQAFVEQMNAQDQGGKGSKGGKGKKGKDKGGDVALIGPAIEDAYAASHPTALLIGQSPAAE